MNDKDKQYFEAIREAWENTKKTKDVARFSLDYCSQLDWLFKQVEELQKENEALKAEKLVLSNYKYMYEQAKR